MPDGNFEAGVKRQAQLLAKDAGFTLEEHLPEHYDELLRHVVRKGVAEDSSMFVQVARNLYFGKFHLSTFLI